MKKRKITLYLGLNDKDSKAQKFSLMKARQSAQKAIFDSGASGCTISNADGIYKHNDGGVVFEKTLKIEIYDIQKNETNKIIDSLKSVFNQESLMLESGIVKSRYV